MTSQNQPYIDEIAAMSYAADRRGEPFDGLLQAALNNGVGRGQLPVASFWTSGVRRTADRTVPGSPRPAAAERAITSVATRSASRSRKRWRPAS